MTCIMHVAWDERLARYDFGPGHPMAPVRVELTVALAHAFGVLGATGVTMATPEPATAAELELVHDGYPARFTPFESGYDPAEPVDQAIMATRNAVFPLNGLMPFH